MELRQLLRPLLAWWWLLLTVPLIAAATGYYLVQRGPTYYQGQTLLNIGPPLKLIDKQIPPLVTIRLGAIYSQIVPQDKFLQLVAQRAEVNESVDELRRATVVYYSPGTPFFTIQFVDTNSTRLLRILKTMAELLTDETPQLRELRRQAQRDFIVRRQQELSELIAQRQKELTALTNQLDVDGDTTGKNLSIQRNAAVVSSDLNSYNEELSELSKLTDESEANQIHIIEEPHLLTIALGPQPKSAAIAMASLTFALMVGIIYLLAKLDKRVHTYQQVEWWLPWKVLMVRKTAKRLDANQQYDLLAADLVATFLDAPQAAKLRLLVLHEKYSVDVASCLQALSLALADLGINVTTTIGMTSQVRSSSSKNFSSATIEAEILETKVAASSRQKAADTNTWTTAGAPPAATTTIQKVEYEWELISQVWPSSTRHISLLSMECSGAVILCSLKRSERTNLIELAAFLDKTHLKVAGVVIV